tara:strand:+ start:1689 stop:2405 length:717 start_codon:yes stop_codon:yes gene_type:complete
MAITLRQESDSRATTKGSALTFSELDNNFKDLLDRATLIVEDSSNSQATIGTTSPELKITGTGAITTSVSTDSTGGAVLSINADAAVDINAGAGITVTQPDSTGAYTIATTAISNVVEDTTPQLGGALDAQDNNITAVGLKDYKEPIHALGSTDSPSISISNGNVQSVTITSGLSLPAFSDAAAGQSVTLIVSGSGTASGTGAYKFAGGNKTLTTESVVSIFFDGSTYYASINTDFQA